MRPKRRIKRGGNLERQILDEGAIAASEPLGELLELDAALKELEERDPRRAQVVKLRYFAGLRIEETAAALGVSSSTVDRDWTYARAWLFQRMTNAR